MDDGVARARRPLRPHRSKDDSRAATEHQSEIPRSWRRNWRPAAIDAWFDASLFVHSPRCSSVSGPTALWSRWSSSTTSGSSPSGSPLRMVKCCSTPSSWRRWSLVSPYGTRGGTSRRRCWRAWRCGVGSIWPVGWFRLGMTSCCTTSGCCPFSVSTMWYTPSGLGSPA